MKKIIFSLFCLFITTNPPLFATTKITAIPLGKVLVVEFTQHRHLASIPTPITSTGILKIIPHQGIIWKTKSPFPNTLVIQKTGLFQVQDEKLISLNKAPQNTLVFDLLSKVFEGNFQGGIKGFKNKNISSGKSSWAVKLTPENDAIKIIIEALEIYGDAQISKIIIRRSQGNRDEIHLNNHTLLAREKALSPQERGWFNGS